ncbi:hypothetical protein LguiA_002624 [Lonicera macranthoides]
MVDKSVVLEGVFHVLGKKTEVLYLRVKDLKNLQKELVREELLKVRDLELQSCDEMVSFVNTVGQQTTNVFQNLESLCLSDMRKLKSICSLSIGSGLINLKRLKVVKLNKMARLKLEGMENLGEMWLTHNLRELIVENCHGLVKIFSSSIAMGSVMLESLTIVGCEMMDAIFWKERGEDEAAATVDLQNLQVLYVSDCGSVEVIFDLQRSNVNEGVNELTVLTRLKELQHLEGLGIRRCSSLQVVFDLQGLNVIRLAGAFQYLRSLTVSVCDSLRHVFTHSIAKLISRLQTLEISNCENLEALVAKEEEEEEEDIVEGGAGGGIFNLFPQLTRLSLKKLPKLLQITLRAYTFNWPSLKYLTLADCGKLTETLYDTIQLQHLQMLEIQRCCSLEVVFNLQGFNDNNEGSYELIAPLLTQLWHINLHSLPKLRHVWKTGAHVIQGSFKNLSWLRVEHCDSLKYVFTPSVAKLLLVLKEMKIIECENLEAIVAEEEEEEECRLELGGGGGINVILFPQLKSIYLDGLQNLLTIMPKPYTFNRSSLHVSGCDKLQDIH